MLQCSVSLALRTLWQLARTNRDTVQYDIPLVITPDSNWGVARYNRQHVKNNVISKNPQLAP